jgi:hypothetical protein
MLELNLRPETLGVDGMFAPFIDSTSIRPIGANIRLDTCSYSAWDRGFSWRYALSRDQNM